MYVQPCHQSSSHWLCLSTAALLVVHLQYWIRDNQSNANNLQLVVVVVVLQEGEVEVQDGWRQSKVYYVHARDTYYRWIVHNIPTGWHEAVSLMKVQRNLHL